MDETPVRGIGSQQPPPSRGSNASPNHFEDFYDFDFSCNLFPMEIEIQHLLVILEDVQKEFVKFRVLVYQTQDNRPQIRKWIEMVTYLLFKIEMTLLHIEKSTGIIQPRYQGPPPPDASY